MLLALAAGLVLPGAALAAPAPASAPPDTFRIRLANSPQGKIEASVDQGETWTLIGHVTRPATKINEGSPLLEVIPAGTVAAATPTSLTIRVPHLQSAPRFLRVTARGEAPSPFTIATDLAPSGILFRALAPALGTQVLLERAGLPDTLPTNYTPKSGDVLQLMSEPVAGAPASVVLENRPDGRVVTLDAKGQETLVGRVRKPLQGIGRYGGTERAGSGAVVSAQPSAFIVSTASKRRRLDAAGKPSEERGGFVIQPFEPMLKGPTHPESQMLVEAAAPEGVATGPISSLFALPMALSSNVPTDRAPTQVDVRADGGDWEPMPDLRGPISAADFLAAVTAARGKGDLKDGITHIRITLGRPQSEVARLALRLLTAKPAGAGAARGSVTIRANTMGDGITFVLFFLDGRQVKITNEAPFAWEWDTTTADNGEHLLEIRAVDAEGKNLNTVITRVLVDN